MEPTDVLAYTESVNRQESKNTLLTFDKDPSRKDGH